MFMFSKFLVTVGNLVVVVLALLLVVVVMGGVYLLLPAFLTGFLAGPNY